MPPLAVNEVAILNCKFILKFTALLNETVMKKMFVFFLLLSSLTAISQTEVSIFDETGNATHYIDYSNGTVYSFDGTPVAFLRAKSNYYNVYNYQGDHLGWFESGIIRDHNGDVVGFQKGAIVNILPKLEPIKGIKKIEPIRPIEKLEPIKPLYSMKFSRAPMEYYLGGNRSNASSGSNNVYNQEIYIPSIEPFTPDFDMIGNVLSTLQARHEKLTGQGYYYDTETQQYISPQNFPSIKQSRVNAIKNALQLWANSAYYKQNEKVKDGTYNVYYLNLEAEYPIVFKDIVIVKKGRVRTMIINKKKIKVAKEGTINKGLAVAKMTQNFGFFSGSVEYPKHLFIFTD